MKVKNFTGILINKYLNITIEFEDDVNFLTGINGSGKTSVLNCIISLLAPRIDFLASFSYKTISISIEIEGVSHTISANRTETGVELLIDDDRSQLLFVRTFSWEDSLPPSKVRDMEQGFYREQLSLQSNSTFMKFIQALPTPMFLGLDRRSINDDEAQSRYFSYSYRYRNARKQNIFSQSLSQGLVEAVGFAVEYYRRCQQQKEFVDDSFRRELVLELIELSPASLPTTIDGSIPIDYRRIDYIKKNILKLPDLLGVPRHVVTRKTEKLFNFIDETIETIGKINNKSIKIVGKKERRKSDEDLLANYLWMINQNILTKISQISDKIGEYNLKITDIFQNSNKFIETINSFLNDSGKKILFNKSSELVFQVGVSDETYDLRELSSGEIQLIVILAHLYFNPEARRAGVFIIDEPELSLHVEWQEKFVDSILESNSTAQLIMATHSPSIIVDRVANCIDMSPRDEK